MEACLPLCGIQWPKGPARSAGVQNVLGGKALPAPGPLSSLLHRGSRGGDVDTVLFYSPCGSKLLNPRLRYYGKRRSVSSAFKLQTCRLPRSHEPAASVRSGAPAGAAGLQSLLL